MFQCKTLYRNTKCRLCSPLAKGYVPPCICGHTSAEYSYIHKPDFAVVPVCRNGL